jgi:hypothetical protein
MKRILCLVALLVVMMATPVVGQTVLNPRTAEFVASDGHDAMFGDVPLVTRYELRHYIVGTTTPVAVFDLGKPTPDVNRLIVVTFPPLAVSDSTLYFARVYTIGPSGESPSNDSNQYGFTGIPSPVGTPTIKR